MFKKLLNNYRMRRTVELKNCFLIAPFEDSEIVINKKATLYINGTTAVMGGDREHWHESLDKFLDKE